MSNREDRPFSRFLKIVIVALWAVMTVGVLLAFLIGVLTGRGDAEAAWGLAAAWVALSTVFAFLFGLTLVRGVA